MIYKTSNSTYIQNIYGTPSSVFELSYLEWNAWCIYDTVDNIQQPVDKENRIDHFPLKKKSLDPESTSTPPPPPPKNNILRSYFAFRV